MVHHVLPIQSLSKPRKRLSVEDVPGPGAVEMELGSFVRWVLDDEPPVLTAAEGRAAVAVAEAADRAKASGQAVALD